MQKYLIAVVLILSGCGPVITPRSNNSGIIEDFSSSDYSQIASAALRHCQQYGFDDANVAPNKDCPICGAGYQTYQFQCRNNISPVERQQIEKDHRIAEARVEKETREQIKIEKAYAAKMQKEQLDADKAKCDEYGMKRGTSAFSACLMQIDQARQQQAQQQQMQLQALQAEERKAALQQQEIQRKKQAAYWTCMGNSGGVRSGLGTDIARANFCAEHYDHPEVWPMNRQPIVVAPAPGPLPAPPLSTHTRCVPGPGGMMNCQTY